MPGFWLYRGYIRVFEEYIGFRAQGLGAPSNKDFNELVASA